MGNKKGIEDIEKDGEEDDEVLPLSEFPLNSDNLNSATDDQALSSDPPPQLFQFFRDDYTPQHMSSAEDIIFHGKLVPFKQAPPPHPPPQPLNHRRRLLGRQFGSLSDSKTSRPEIQDRYERNCRSLDSQKTARSEMGRDSSGRSVGSVSGGRSTRFPKFRWLMFGMVKLPPEMELRDIKSRQTRRSPTAMFSPENCRRSGSGKGSWAVLRALSCRDDASVAVATPFGCVPST